MKLIKKQDKFGHPILLQFNNSGSTFNTACGGCISILINIFMLVFVTQLVRKWIGKEDDTLTLRPRKIRDCVVQVYLSTLVLLYIRLHTQPVPSPMCVKKQQHNLSFNYYKNIKKSSLTLLIFVDIL